MDKCPICAEGKMCWACQGEDDYIASLTTEAYRIETCIPSVLARLEDKKDSEIEIGKNKTNKEIHAEKFKQKKDHVDNRIKCLLWLKFDIVDNSQSNMINDIKKEFNMIQRKQLLKALLDKFKDDNIEFRGVNMMIEKYLKCSSNINFNHLNNLIQKLLKNDLPKECDSIPAIVRFISKHIDTTQRQKLGEQLQKEYENELNKLATNMDLWIENIIKIITDPKYTNYVKEGRVDRSKIARSKESVIENEQQLIAGLVLKSFIDAKSINIIVVDNRKRNENREYSASVQKYDIQKYIEQCAISIKILNDVIHKVYHTYGKIAVPSYQTAIVEGKVSSIRSLELLKKDIANNKSIYVKLLKESPNFLTT